MSLYRLVTTLWVSGDLSTDSKYGPVARLPAPPGLCLYSDIVHLAHVIHCYQNTGHKDQKHNVLQFIATIKIFTSCKTKFIFDFHSNIFDNFVPLLTTLKNICKDTKNILKYIVCY